MVNRIFEITLIIIVLLYLTCRGRKQFVFWLDLSIGHYPLFTKLVSGFLSFLRVHLQAEVIFWKSDCLVLLKMEVQYGLCKPKNYDSNLFVTILMGLNLNFEIFFILILISLPLLQKGTTVISPRFLGMRQ